MRKLLAGVLAVMLLGACAPVAEVIADTIERSDGATLTYVMADQEGGPGLAFDPDGRTAHGVIIRGEADSFTLLSVPEGATCEVTETLFDCRLGDVTSVTLVGVTGTNVTANATWRRAGSNAIFLTFADLPGG